MTRAHKKRSSSRFEQLKNGSNELLDQQLVAMKIYSLSDWNAWKDGEG